MLQDILVPATSRPDAVVSVYSSRFETYIVYAGGADPTQRHIYRHQTRSLNVNPGSENDTALTTEPGVHAAVFGRNGGGPYVVTSTTTKTMPKSTVFNRDGVKLGELPSVAAEPELKPDVTVLRVGGDAGYYAAVVRPKNFDPKKKYPVILDVYGGPKHLHVVQAMRNWLVPQWLADQGFVVVAIDNRGTPGRGREWETGIYQKFGTVPLDDQVKGLHLLCDKFPELDRDRVGIVGWSFGGYMAANGVLRKPDVFKAAVAGAPVTDWEDYDTHYTERYMGLLPESKKEYDDASLLPLAKDLKRPLLLVHGTADDNVYYRHTLEAVERAVPRRPRLRIAAATGRDAHVHQRPRGDGAPVGQDRHVLQDAPRRTEVSDGGSEKRRSPHTLSERKHRLFMCGLCRQMLPWLDSPELFGVLDTSERYADGSAAVVDLRRACELALHVMRGMPDDSGRWCIARAVAWTTAWEEPSEGNHYREIDYFIDGNVSTFLHGALQLRWDGRTAPSVAPEYNTFFDEVKPRLGPFSPGWRTDTAVSLARMMYESREFGAMPILADAIQDAGCDDPAILDHCRDANQVHVRGCWVVDLVLGKA